MVDAIMILAQGFGLVMGILAALWLVSALMGRILGVAKAPGAPPPAVAAPAPAVDAPGVPAAHLAAISAAVAATSGGGARVVSVRIPAHGIAGWVGSAHTHHAVGRRMAATLRSPAAQPTPNVSGSPEDAT